MIKQNSERSVMSAIKRGLLRRCPACGRGTSLHRYLKIVDHCDCCGEALGHIRADDMPPYFTILIVGHLVVPLALLTEQTMAPALWLQMVLWPSLTLVLSLATLPYVKGGVIGLMWALGLRGDETQ